MSRIKKFEEVRSWAEKRGLYTFGDPKTQTVKMMEELGEFSNALLKQDLIGMNDAIGDMQIVLINLASICGFKAEECFEDAFREVASREGKMDNGTFKKDESIGIPYAIEKLQTNCPECDIDLTKATGYVCNNPKCPVQIHVTS